MVLHGFQERVRIACRNRFGRERSHLTRFEGVLAVTVHGRATAELSVLTALTVDQLQ
ncbi:hypothetical protein ACIOHS_36995 [Streptomyces sp. NPDC088253]|uniref:hypothetical protein n=1 Tax=Streptomyces sp. NPDC088253 TaxID=3365846 RepID=UPI003819B74E